jgi:C1A family cysteine protease
VIACALALLLIATTLVARGAGQQDADAINQAIRSLGASWTAGETSMSRLSPQEQARRCGALLEAVPDERRMAAPFAKALPPEHFDWRDVDGDDWTTAIRDQGNCGSCWDFSVIGVFESLLDIASEDPADSSGEDLSEQYVLSCCDDCGSCGGGWPSQAFEFLRETGTVPEACLPYTADDTVACGSACGDVPQQLGAWTYTYNDVESIKRAIFRYGPVSACFEVYQDFFSYVSGVYEHVTGDYTGRHAIVIVGWDDAEESWICKNSWGTGWGENGWFRIRWGDCEINNDVLMATLTDWPAGLVNVTVLDGLGLPAEGADIYANRNWYGRTSRSGTASLDLLEGMSYEVMAIGWDRHLVLYSQVEAPGSLVLDCRNASFVTATSVGVDGLPIDVDLQLDMGGDWWFTAETTSDGAGWFYITPGVYDLTAVSRWDSPGSEKYALFFGDVDLTHSTALTIDARTVATGRFVVQTLLDFPWLNVSMYGDVGPGFGFDLEEGDSVICQTGRWWLYESLVQGVQGESTWRYSLRSSGPYVLEAGQVVELEAGGELSLSATPDRARCEPGTDMGIQHQLTDAFGNVIAHIYVYDYSLSEVLTWSYEVAADGQTTAFHRDGTPVSAGSRHPLPWLTVTSPSLVNLIDRETWWSRWETLYLDSGAEIGTYSIRVTQETHAGVIEGTGSFEVVLPASDPYEPNDACDSAHDLGNVPPAFTSEVASFFDPNADWFTFSLTESGLLVIDTQLLGGRSNTAIYLYNACGGELLAFNDDYMSSASHIEYGADPGTYYLRIEPTWAGYGGDRQYTFTIDLQPRPEIALQGDHPITISIPAGGVESFPGLVSVSNVGQAGSTLNYRILWQEDPPPGPMAVAPVSAEAFRELFPAGSGEPPSSQSEPPTFAWDLLLIDPDEPQPMVADLKELYAQIDGGTLYIGGTTYEPWANLNDLQVAVFLDVDQDPATGYNAEDISWPIGIGADYVLFLPDGVLLRFVDGGLVVAGDLDYASMPWDANEFVVGVALSRLLPRALSESGGINLVVCAMDYDNGNIDQAPDLEQGHATYPPRVGWLSLTPDNGELAQGGTDSIDLTVAASTLVPGTIQHVRLFFLSNDGRTTLTRDVEVTVEPAVCQDLGDTLESAGWQMLALPGTLCSPCAWAEGGELCGDLICALSDDVQPFFAFRYDPGSNSYVMVPPRENVCYRVGMGFWIHTGADHEVFGAAVQAPTAPVYVPVENGWNQIGNPFTFDVRLADTRIRYQGEEVTLEQAQTNHWISMYLFGYDPASGGYVMTMPPSGVLNAVSGYWLRAYVDCEISIPPIPVPPAPPSGVQRADLPALYAQGIPTPPAAPMLSAMAVSILDGLVVRNEPNPVRSEHTTTFKVTGPKADLVGAIRVEIYDLTGQLVWREEVQARETQWHTDDLRGDLLANGVYLYQIWVQVGDTWLPTGIRKVAVLR